MTGKNFLSNISTFSGETYQIWAIKFWTYLVVNDLRDMVETNFVSSAFEELMDTQIRDHRVAVRQRSKASIHISVFDTIFTRIMADDLIENKLFSIKIKRRSFTMNWSDFDNSKVEHDDEIKNSDPEKIQEEIIDKSGDIKLIPDIYQDYNISVFESTDFDGDDKMKNHAEFHIFCIGSNIVKECSTLNL